jgi:hypothetical protein
VLLTDGAGQYLRDVVNKTGQKGESTISLSNLDLKPGIYFLYQIVNNQITHMQELEVN